jgi:hypothetical protein
MNYVEKYGRHGIVTHSIATYFPESFLGNFIEISTLRALRNDQSEEQIFSKHSHRHNKSHHLAAIATSIMNRRNSYTSRSNSPQRSFSGRALSSPSLNGVFSSIRGGEVGPPLLGREQVPRSPHSHLNIASGSNGFADNFIPSPPHHVHDPSQAEMIGVASMPPEASSLNQRDDDGSNVSAPCADTSFSVWFLK